jgi:hypothetical protein
VKPKLPLISFVLSLPFLARAVLEQQPFGGDQSQYGTAALQLHAAMRHEPSICYATMLDTMRFKAPGLPWSGQFVLPLTAWGIPADIVLRFSVAVAVAASLWLMGAAARRLGFSPLAVLGFLALVAGTPMLQSFAADYMTEAPQTVVVAWLLFIMASAPRWERGFLLAQLALAGLTAVLLKVSSPFYICLPAAVAAWHLFRRPPQGRPWGILSSKTLVTVVVLLLVTIPAIHWITIHQTAVLHNVREATSGPVAALWGKEDTYCNTLLYWLQACLSLFPFLIAGVAALLVATANRWLAPTRASRGQPRRPSAAVGILCVAQMILVLLFAGMSANHQQRFLLPLLPYAALLTAWSFSRLGYRWAPPLFVALGLTWWLGGSLVSLGILAGGPGSGARLSLDSANRRLLEDIVQRAEADAPAAGASVIIAVDPVFFGDWLAPEPAGFTAWKFSTRGDQPRPKVSYRYAGNSFLGAGPEETLRHLVDSEPRFVIACDPDVHPPEQAKFNRSLQGENGRLFFRHLMESGRFAPPMRLEEDPGLLLFRAVKPSP